MKTRAAFGLRREMGALLLGRVLTALAGLVGVRILTAVMSPELYGKYALVIGYIGLVAGLFVSPMGQAMNRFIHDAAQAGMMRAFLGRGLSATTAMALLGGLGVPILLYFYLHGHEERRAIGFLVVLALLGANLRDRQFGIFNTFRWRGRYVILATLDAWMKTLAIAAGIWLLGSSLFPAVLGMTIGTWAVALVGLPWLVELSRHNPPNPTHAFELRALTRYALPLFGVNLLSWVVASSDRYVIAGLLDEAEVGRYVASAQVALVAPGILASAFFPMFTPILFQRMATHPDEPLHLDKYALGIAAFGLLLGGLVIVDVDAVFGMLVSRIDYQTGDTVVPFVLFGQLCYVLHQLAEHEAHFQKRPGRLNLANGAAALVSLSLTLLLTPRLGITGSAMAASVTYATLLGSTVWLYKPAIAGKTWGSIGSMTLATIAMIVLVRTVIPSDLSAWMRAPSRWGLFILLFLGAAWPLAKHRLPALRTPIPS